MYKCNILTAIYLFIYLFFVLFIKKKYKTIPALCFSIDYICGMNLNKITSILY